MNNKKKQSIVDAIEAEHNALLEKERANRKQRRKKHLVAGIGTVAFLTGFSFYFNVGLLMKAAELVAAATIHTILYGGVE